MRKNVQLKIECLYQNAQMIAGDGKYIVQFFFSTSNEFSSYQSQFLQKLCLNVLKTYKGVLLILKDHEWLLQFHILCIWSHQNWLSYKKNIKKKHTSIESKICVFRT